MSVKVYVADANLSLQNGVNNHHQTLQGTAKMLETSVDFCTHHDHHFLTVPRSQLPLAEDVLIASNLLYWVDEKHPPRNWQGVKTREACKTLGLVHI